MAERRLPVGFIALGALLAIGLVAIPVLAAQPWSAGSRTAAAAPSGAQPDGSTGRGNGKGHGPKIPITVSGTISTVTDAKGRTEYRLTADGTTYILDGGPAWWYGGDHPLAASVGKTVTIIGSTREGSNEIDVETVDGVALREPGKPPWAGGPWTVGESHPGWKAWMADGKPGRGHGDGDAPGQQKPDEGGSGEGDQS